LFDENKRLVVENERMADELEQGMCAKLHEYDARIDELEQKLAALKQHRDTLKAKYE